MLRYLINRLIQGGIVMIVLFTLTFFLVKSLPGSPFKTEKAIPEHIQARMNAYYGLDQPLPVQFAKRASNILKGDFGSSLRLEGREVTEIISQAFPVSFQLGIVAITLAIGIGIPLGVIAAWKKNSLLDYSSMALAMIGICLPSFVIGPVLANRFGQEWQILPAMGWATLNPLYWILPAITLGLASAAYLSRLTRAGMLDTLSQDFVRTARAKGVSQKNILIRHCLRGGLSPAVAYIGPAFAGIISGSLVIESVFALPGLGTHFIKAIETGDEPVLTGIVLLFGVLIILANFATDILAYWLNPRLRS
ncbi:ABC transporter permease [Haloferula chungangensis]|uniref:ABC transporter permease n=1 Tax=Haloferula chungangensis TaxID=1048331 RepID=A0ABW2L6U4_9BACT